MDTKRATLAAGAALVIALGGWWAFAPRKAETPVEAPVATKRKDGVLAVVPAKAVALGIATAPAAAATEAPLADLPATIAPPPNARQAVAAALPGTVVRTFVVEGDSVRAGQPLAVIASRDVLTLGADLSRATARAGVARSSASRLSQLSHEGIIAGARADEARALAAEASADVSEKARILRMVGGSAGSGTYTLIAPIAGRVTKADIQTGSPVDGTTAPFVIDAAGQYEIVAQVPERLVGAIRPGMAVRVGDLSGTVTSIGSTIDPMTRSALLKARIPSSPGLLAGRVATVTVFDAASPGAVMVPSAAVAQIDGADVVFVAVPGGFAMRKVVTGGTAAGLTFVRQGVKPGERIVTAGTAALKALALSN